MERVNGNGSEAPRINKVEPIGIKYPSMRKHEGYRAERHLTRFNAENSSVFSPANNVCRIPVQSGSFLDLNSATLGFDLTNTTATTISLDDSAACCISRIRILNLQGQELERLESYALLSSVLDRYTKQWTSTVGTPNLDGSPCKNDYSPAYAAITANSGAAALAATTALTENNSGVTATLLNTYTGATGQNQLTLSSQGGQGFLQSQADSLATTGVSVENTRLYNTKMETVLISLFCNLSIKYSLIKLVKPKMKNFWNIVHGSQNTLRVREQASV